MCATKRAVLPLSSAKKVRLTSFNLIYWFIFILDVSRPVLLEKKLYTALDSLLSAKWDVLMLEGAAGCALLGEHSGTTLAFFLGASLLL